MKIARATVLVLVVVAAVSVGVPKRAVSDGPTTDVGERVDEFLANAARETLDIVTTEYANGARTEEDIYRWSRRLMRAELQVSTDAAEQRQAVQRHIARMLGLQQKQEALKRVEMGKLSNLNATIYYVAAAKRDLEQLDAASESESESGRQLPHRRRTGKLTPPATHGWRAWRGRSACHPLAIQRDAARS